MSTITKQITVFEGTWGERVYAFGLDEATTRNAVEDGYAFGDPSEDDYAVGNEWAKSEDANGWRIIERPVAVAIIAGKKSGDVTSNETCHLIWQCPHCNRQVSEDLYQDDHSPMLLGCGCQNTEKYILVEF